MQKRVDPLRVEQQSPWLPEGEPLPGRLARARIRRAEDINTIDAVQPAAVLPGPTIYECIRSSATLDPKKPAIVHLLSADVATTPRAISYADLLDSIERTASLFHRLKGPYRSSVGIILPMVPEALIAAWAASTAGIASPINPYLEPDHVIALLNASQATVLVIGCAKHGRGVWDKSEQLVGAVPTLQRVFIVDGDDPQSDFAAAVAAQPPGLAFSPNRDPQAESTYLPTGGTTAAPKLVRMTHQGQLLMAWLIGAHAGAASHDVIGHAMPNFHVGGANLLTLRAVLYGQTFVTLTTGGFRNADIVRNFWDIVRKYRITSLIATPATAAALLAQTDANSRDHGVQIFNCGGSTIPVDVLRGFQSRFGVWLREIWGMSEFHGMVSIHPDVSAEPVVGSVGQAAPWHRIKVVELDAENRFLRECSPGERGALIASGVALAPGYVDERFNAAFFVTGMPGSERWANTGDLGTMDDFGNVWIFGRAKDVIIRGGHNIDPKLIEDVLIRHAAVQIAAAVGQPDAAKGEMPIAYVQLKTGATSSAEELLALCRDQVQERAAVPVRIHIVELLPLTAVGKINKPALRADAMLRVATEQASTVVGARGSVDVAIDESGVRPRVKLSVRSTPSEFDTLRQQLELVFGRYEFETIISSEEPRLSGEH